MDFSSLLEDYTEDNLVSILNFKGWHSAYEVKNFHFYIYLQEYLSEAKGLGATHCLIEREYISKDYIDDYSDFYSLCFQTYEKKCLRVHFFNFKGEENYSIKFVNAFYQKDSKTFWDNHYLGFVVIKPIPSSIIGYTLLKTYNHKENIFPYLKERQFWGIKSYEVHLFGEKIEIESLAFQQQDNVLSACATISIWVLLHRASTYPYVPLKSPGKITIEAGLTDAEGGRLIPNKKGLIIPAMSEAITKSNLLTEVRMSQRNQNFNKYIKKLIFAYSHLHLPIIMALKVPSNGKFVGHAVAICGHKISNVSRRSKFNKILKQATANLQNEINLSKLNTDFIAWHALDMEEIYVHDDQWGPFTRMKFLKNRRLSSSWSDYHKENKKAKPEVLLISVYPKVRISYDDIEPIVYGINELLEQLLEDELRWDLTWAIKVQRSTEYKDEFLESAFLDINNIEDKKLIDKVLLLELPRYIWVATCYSAECKFFDFIFDATDFSGGVICLSILNYYPIISTGLSERIKDDIIENTEYIENFKNILPYRILQFLVNNFNDNDII